jgi:predicted AlkP superfamily phosphohydrolase/phosphomutase
MDEGVHGDLRSTIPPSSIPAWPSFLTGKNPGKHGIFDFMKRTPNDYIGKMISSNDFKTDTIVDILNEAGKTSVIINITSTYPPKPLKGCIVSGMLTPKDATYVYPAVLQPELDGRGYVIFKDFDKYTSSSIVFKELVSMEQKRKEIALSLMRIFDWDLFMVLLIGTDTIQHRLWGEKKWINNYYREIDSIIGEIIGNVEEKTNTIIVSDHGFGPLEKYININKWLEKKGLLRTRRVETEATRIYKVLRLRSDVVKNKNLLSRLGLTADMFKPFVNILRVLKISQIIPPSIKRGYGSLPKTELAIDWARTKVALSSFFTTETQSLIINLKGREPQGIVDPFEYKSLRNSVISKLKKIGDPDTGENVFINIYAKEELYHGSYLENAPDIVMMLKGGYKASNSLKGDRIFESIGQKQGSHRIMGIFIARGPDFKKKVMLKNARIIDIMPTILKVMGVDIPSQTDGQVLSEVLV